MAHGGTIYLLGVILPLLLLFVTSSALRPDQACYALNCGSHARCVVRKLDCTAGSCPTMVFCAKDLQEEAMGATSCSKVVCSDGFTCKVKINRCRQGICPVATCVAAKPQEVLEVCRTHICPRGTTCQEKKCDHPQCHPEPICVPVRSPQLAVHTPFRPQRPPIVMNPDEPVAVKSIQVHTPNIVERCGDHLCNLDETCQVVKTDCGDKICKLETLCISKDKDLTLDNSSNRLGNFRSGYNGSSHSQKGEGDLIPQQRRFDLKYSIANNTRYPKARRAFLNFPQKNAISNVAPETNQFEEQEDIFNNGSNHGKFNSFSHNISSILKHNRKDNDRTLLGYLRVLNKLHDLRRDGKTLGVRKPNSEHEKGLVTIERENSDNDIPHAIPEHLPQISPKSQITVNFPKVVNRKDSVLNVRLSPMVYVAHKYIRNDEAEDEITHYTKNIDETSPASKDINTKSTPKRDEYVINIDKTTELYLVTENRYKPVKQIDRTSVKLTDDVHNTSQPSRDGKTEQFISTESPLVMDIHKDHKSVHTTEQTSEMKKLSLVPYTRTVYKPVIQLGKASLKLIDDINTVPNASQFEYQQTTQSISEAIPVVKGVHKDHESVNIKEGKNKLKKVNLFSYPKYKPIIQLGKASLKLIDDINIPHSVSQLSRDQQTTLSISEYDSPVKDLHEDNELVYITKEKRKMKQPFGKLNKASMKLINNEHIIHNGSQEFGNGPAKRVLWEDIPNEKNRFHPAIEDNYKSNEPDQKDIGTRTDLSPMERASLQRENKKSIINNDSQLFADQENKPRLSNQMTDNNEIPRKIINLHSVPKKILKNKTKYIPNNKGVFQKAGRSPVIKGRNEPIIQLGKASLKLVNMKEIIHNASQLFGNGPTKNIDNKDIRKERTHPPSTGQQFHNPEDITDRKDVFENGNLNSVTKGRYKSIKQLGKALLKNANYKQSVQNTRQSASDGRKKQTFKKQILQNKVKFQPPLQHIYKKYEPGNITEKKGVPNRPNLASGRKANHRLVKQLGKVSLKLMPRHNVSQLFGDGQMRQMDNIEKLNQRSSLALAREKSQAIQDRMNFHQNEQDILLPVTDSPKRKFSQQSLNSKGSQSTQEIISRYKKYGLPREEMELLERLLKQKEEMALLFPKPPQFSPPESSKQNELYMRQTENIAYVASSTTEAAVPVKGDDKMFINNAEGNITDSRDVLVRNETIDNKDVLPRNDTTLNMTTDNQNLHELSDIHDILSDIAQEKHSIEKKQGVVYHKTETGQDTSKSLAGHQQTGNFSQEDLRSKNISALSYHNESMGAFNERLYSNNSSGKMFPKATLLTHSDIWQQNAGSTKITTENHLTEIQQLQAFKSQNNSDYIADISLNIHPEQSTTIPAAKEEILTNPKNQYPEQNLKSQSGILTIKNSNLENDISKPNELDSNRKGLNLVPKMEEDKIPLTNKTSLVQNLDVHTTDNIQEVYKIVPDPRILTNMVGIDEEFTEVPKTTRYKQDPSEAYKNEDIKMTMTLNPLYRDINTSTNQIQLETSGVTVGILTDTDNIYKEHINKTESILTSSHGINQSTTPYPSISEMQSLVSVNFASYSTKSDNYIKTTVTESVYNSSDAERRDADETSTNNLKLLDQQQNTTPNSEIITGIPIEKGVEKIRDLTTNLSKLFNIMLENGNKSEINLTLYPNTSEVEEAIQVLNNLFHINLTSYPKTSGAEEAIRALNNLLHVNLTSYPIATDVEEAIRALNNLIHINLTSFPKASDVEEAIRALNNVSIDNMKNNDESNKNDLSDIQNALHRASYDAAKNVNRKTKPTDWHRRGTVRHWNRSFDAKTRDADETNKNSVPSVSDIRSLFRVTLASYSTSSDTVSNSFHAKTKDADESNNNNVSSISDVQSLFRVNFASYSTSSDTDNKIPVANSGDSNLKKTLQNDDSWDGHQTEAEISNLLNINTKDADQTSTSDVPSFSEIQTVFPLTSQSHVTPSQEPNTAARKTEVRTEPPAGNQSLRDDVHKEDNVPLKVRHEVKSTNHQKIPEWITKVEESTRNGALGQSEDASVTQTGITIPVVMENVENMTFTVYTKDDINNLELLERNCTGIEIGSYKDYKSENQPCFGNEKQGLIFKSGPESSTDAKLHIQSISDYETQDLITKSTRDRTNTRGTLELEPTTEKVKLAIRSDIKIKNELYLHEAKSKLVDKNISGNVRGSELEKKPILEHDNPNFIGDNYVIRSDNESILGNGQSDMMNKTQPGNTRGITFKQEPDLLKDILNNINEIEPEDTTGITSDKGLIPTNNRPDSIKEIKLEDNKNTNIINIQIPPKEIPDFKYNIPPSNETDISLDNRAILTNNNPDFTDETKPEETTHINHTEVQISPTEVPDFKNKIPSRNGTDIRRMILTNGKFDFITKIKPEVITQISFTEIKPEDIIHIGKQISPQEIPNFLKDIKLDNTTNIKLDDELNLKNNKSDLKLQTKQQDINEKTSLKETPVFNNEIPSDNSTVSTLDRSEEDIKQIPEFFKQFKSSNITNKVDNGDFLKSNWPDLNIETKSYNITGKKFAQNQSLSQKIPQVFSETEPGNTTLNKFDDGTKLTNAAFDMEKRPQDTSGEKIMQDLSLVNKIPNKTESENSTKFALDNESGVVSAEPKLDIENRLENITGINVIQEPILSKENPILINGIIIDNNTAIIFDNRLIPTINKSDLKESKPENVTDKNYTEKPILLKEMPVFVNKDKTDNGTDIIVVNRLILTNDKSEHIKESKPEDETHKNHSEKLILSHKMPVFVKESKAENVTDKSFTEKSVSPPEIPDFFKTIKSYNITNVKLDYESNLINNKSDLNVEIKLQNTTDNKFSQDPILLQELPYVKSEIESNNTTFIKLDDVPSNLTYKKPDLIKEKRTGNITIIQSTKKPHLTNKVGLNITTTITSNKEWILSDYTHEPITESWTGVVAGTKFTQEQIPSKTDLNNEKRLVNITDVQLITKRREGIIETINETESEDIKDIKLEDVSPFPTENLNLIQDIGHMAVLLSSFHPNMNNITGNGTILDNKIEINTAKELITSSPGLISDIKLGNLPSTKFIHGNQTSNIVDVKIDNDVISMSEISTVKPDVQHRISINGEINITQEKQPKIKRGFESEVQLTPNNEEVTERISATPAFNGNVSTIDAHERPLNIGVTYDKKIDKQQFSIKKIDTNHSEMNAEFEVRMDNVQNVIPVSLATEHSLMPTFKNPRVYSKEGPDELLPLQKTGRSSDSLGTNSEGQEMKAKDEVLQGDELQEDLIKKEEGSKVVDGQRGYLTKKNNKTTAVVEWQQNLFQKDNKPTTADVNFFTTMSQELLRAERNSSLYDDHGLREQGNSSAIWSITENNFVNDIQSTSDSIHTTENLQSTEDLLVTPSNLMNLRGSPQALEKEIFSQEEEETVPPSTTPIPMQQLYEDAALANHSFSYYNNHYSSLFKQSPVIYLTPFQKDRGSNYQNMIEDWQKLLDGVPYQTINGKRYYMKHPVLFHFNANTNPSSPPLMQFVNNHGYDIMRRPSFVDKIDNSIELLGETTQTVNRAIKTTPFMLYYSAHLEGLPLEKSNRSSGMNREGGEILEKDKVFPAIFIVPQSKESISKLLNNFKTSDQFETIQKILNTANDLQEGLIKNDKRLKGVDELHGNVFDKENKPTVADKSQLNLSNKDKKETAGDERQENLIVKDKNLTTNFWTPTPKFMKQAVNNNNISKSSLGYVQSKTEYQNKIHNRTSEYTVSQLLNITHHFQDLESDHVTHTTQKYLFKSTETSSYEDEFKDGPITALLNVTASQIEDTEIETQFPSEDIKEAIQKQNLKTGDNRGKEHHLKKSRAGTFTLENSHLTERKLASKKSKKRLNQLEHNDLNDSLRLGAIIMNPIQKKHKNQYEAKLSKLLNISNMNIIDSSVNIQKKSKILNLHDTGPLLSQTHPLPPQNTTDGSDDEAINIMKQSEPFSSKLPAISNRTHGTEQDKINELQNESFSSLMKDSFSISHGMDPVLNNTSQNQTLTSEIQNSPSVIHKIDPDLTNTSQNQSVSVQLPDSSNGTQGIDLDLTNKPKSELLSSELQNLFKGSHRIEPISFIEGQGELLLQLSNSSIEHLKNVYIRNIEGTTTNNTEENNSVLEGILQSPSYYSDNNRTDKKIKISEIINVIEPLLTGNRTIISKIHKNITHEQAKLDKAPRSRQKDKNAKRIISYYRKPSKDKQRQKKYRRYYEVQLSYSPEKMSKDELHSKRIIEVLMLTPKPAIQFNALKSQHKKGRKFGNTSVSLRLLEKQGSERPAKERKPIVVDDSLTKTDELQNDSMKKKQMILHVENNLQGHDSVSKTVQENIPKLYLSHRDNSKDVDDEILSQNIFPGSKNGQLNTEGRYSKNLNVNSSETITSSLQEGAPLVRTKSKHGTKFRYISPVKNEMLKGNSIEGEEVSQNSSDRSGEQNKDDDDNNNNNMFSDLKNEKLSTSTWQLSKRHYSKSLDMNSSETSMSYLQANAPLVMNRLMNGTEFRHIPPVENELLKRNSTEVKEVSQSSFDRATEQNTDDDDDKTFSSQHDYINSTQTVTEMYPKKNTLQSRNNRQKIFWSNSRFYRKSSDRVNKLRTRKNIGEDDNSFIMFLEDSHLHEKLKENYATSSVHSNSETSRSVYSGTSSSVHSGTSPSIPNGTSPSVPSRTPPSVYTETSPSVPSGTSPSVSSETSPSLRSGTFPSVPSEIFPSVRSATFRSVSNGTFPSVRNGTFPSISSWTSPSVQKTSETSHPILRITQNVSEIGVNVSKDDILLLKKISNLPLNIKTSNKENQTTSHIKNRAVSFVGPPEPEAVMDRRTSNKTQDNQGKKDQLKTSNNLKVQVRNRAANFSAAITDDSDEQNYMKAVRKELINFAPNVKRKNYLHGTGWRRQGNNANEATEAPGQGENENEQSTTTTTTTPIPICIPYPYVNFADPGRKVPAHGVNIIDPNNNPSRFAYNMLDIFRPAGSNIDYAETVLPPPDFQKPKID